MTELPADVAAEVAKAARELTEIKDQLRETHGEPVAELPSMTVFADRSGHELRELAAHHNTEHGTDLSREEIAEWMHEQARGIEYNWSASDPVVVLHD